MIKIESPKEFALLLGATVMEVEVLPSSDPDPCTDEVYCAEEEILLHCWTEKRGCLEVRIYIDPDGNLCVYTD